MKFSKRGNDLRTFNKTILMIGTALFLQGCQTTASNENIAVTNEVSPADQMAQEMTNGSVKVFSLDEAPPPPPPAMTDAGLGYVAPPAVSTGSMDPNVLVFPLDDVPSPVVYQDGPPPLMPPAAEVPFSSPFPDTAAAPPSVMLSPPGAMPFEPAVAVNGAQIFFPHGSSKISATGRQVVDSVAARGGGYITVEGHASARGEAADPVEKRIVNLKMSMDRAFNVSSDLIRKGVPPEAITTTVYGDARPAATEDTSRRVEILTRP